MPREYQIDHELRHLVYFQAVARHLHFRKAAEALTVAQPALSRQIAQLETALGVSLFVRSRRRVELTPAGQTLLKRVEPLLHTLVRLPVELRAVAQGELGRVRVAFTGLAMATVLPDILRQFARHYPRIKVELNESPTAEQLPALRTGEIDCGFFHPSATVPPDVATKVLLQERNGLLLPADHPLSQVKNLRLRDLATTPFVLFPRAHNPGFYDRIISVFTGLGLTPEIAEEVWPRANGIGLVRAGLGVTFITPSEGRQLPDGVVFRPLQGPTPESRLVIGWRTHPEPEPAVMGFIKTATTLSSSSQRKGS